MKYILKRQPHETTVSEEAQENDMSDLFRIRLKYILPHKLYQIFQDRL